MPLDNTLTILSDNTRVFRLPLVERKLSKFPFIIDRGKEVPIKRLEAKISSDKRNKYLKLLDRKSGELILKQREKNEKLKEGSKNLQGFLTFISPSTWAGAATRNNGKSYFENVASGEGFGNEGVNLFFDLTTPFAIGGVKSLATSAVKRFPLTKHLWRKRQFKSPAISLLSDSFIQNSNPNVNSDALNLHFERLKNGGYDKLEKLLLDYMANNPLSSGSLHFNDNGRIGEMPFVRKNLRDLVSMETPLNPNSIFTEQDLLDAGGAIAFTSQGMIEYSPEALLKNGYDISRSLSHELDHALHIPIEKPQGFDLSKLSDTGRLYFTKFRGTELSARGSQIKDWLKFNRSDLNITESDLKNAALNYINDTGINNKMTLFFNSISDYKKAAEWLSKYSTGLSIPIILNKNE